MNKTLRMFLARRARVSANPFIPGHHPVDDDQVIGALAGERESACAVFGIVDCESGLEQIIADDLAHIFIIIDHQDMFHHSSLLAIH